MSEPIQIDKGKTYVLEVDHVVSTDHVRSIMKDFKESTGSNVIVLHGARLARVASEAEEAIERVRELHKPWTHKYPTGFEETYCSCDEQLLGTYPCPTIQALDGEQ